MIDTFLKTVQLKRMETFNFLSIEGIRKGYLFREKWYIKGYKGVPPRINICSVPPPGKPSP